MYRKYLCKVERKIGRLEVVYMQLSMHDDIKARINLNGTFSEPIPVEICLKQRNAISPSLFAYYLTFLLSFVAFKNVIYVKCWKLFNLSRLVARRKVAYCLIRKFLNADDCHIFTHSDDNTHVFINYFRMRAKH